MIIHESKILKLLCNCDLFNVANIINKNYFLGIADKNQHDRSSVL